MELGVLEAILVIFAGALLVATTFHRLRVPVILGYLLVGALVGPHGFRLVTDTHNVQELAEFGVVFLMFNIGLEFSLSKLIQLSKAVFVYGSLQVLTTFLITMGIATWLKMTFEESVLISMIVSLSSTALVSKQLTTQNELGKEHGKNSIGILLFQDLCVAPFFIVTMAIGDPHSATLATTLGFALIKGVLALGVILFAGHFVMRPLFNMMKLKELYTMMTLLVALASAWLTHMVGLK